MAGSAPFPLPSPGCPRPCPPVAPATAAELVVDLQMQPQEMEVSLLSARLKSRGPAMGSPWPDVPQQTGTGQGTRLPRVWDDPRLTAPLRGLEGVRQAGMTCGTEADTSSHPAAAWTTPACPRRAAPSPSRQSSCPPVFAWLIFHERADNSAPCAATDPIPMSCGAPPGPATPELGAAGTGIC